MEAEAPAPERFSIEALEQMDIPLFRTAFKDVQHIGLLVWYPEDKLRMKFQPCGNSILAGQSIWNKVQRLLKSFVWFGATEPKETAASFAEAFAA